MKSFFRRTSLVEFISFFSGIFLSIDQFFCFQRYKWTVKKIVNYKTEKCETLCHCVKTQKYISCWQHAFADKQGTKGKACEKKIFGVSSRVTGQISGHVRVNISSQLGEDTADARRHSAASEKQIQSNRWIWRQAEKKKLSQAYAS